tara:strand:- start:2391 stop:3509 length:1119 start_codon:yes stop_codon:yes gene_type:complete
MKNIKFYEPEITYGDKKELFSNVNNGWISSQAPIVSKFEFKFAKWHKMKFALATSNCTTALHLSLLSLNLNSTDEVICTNLTFIAPANMIALTGAKLILVDVDKDDFAMSIEDLKKKINKKTKVIMVVHPFGFPAKIDKIKNIAKRNNIKIIEDVAESIGAKVNNRLCGTFGDISCYSFFANKIMTTGEGGMILTNNKKLYLKMKLLRDHGMSQDKKYFHKFLAFNYRMTSMQAALGFSQLKRLNLILKKKNLIEKNYIRFLPKINMKDIYIRKEIKKNEIVSWFVTITLKKRQYRDQFIEYMKNKKVECRPMVFPVSHANHFKNFYDSSNFPNATSISLRSVHLPSSATLKLNQIKYICNHIKNWLKTKKK